ncbi:S8 family peptidase [Kribbella deserti]|uniref:S8 family serine peptidase n=1 Tax=Kribbella deserti TaxID=1926257 RepID=A0ABV6QQ90_9ACTN
MTRPRSKRWLAAAAMAAALAATAIPFRPSAAEPTAGKADSSAGLLGKSVTITLITGDKVTYRPGHRGGAGQAVHVQPGPGREGMVFQKHALGNKQTIVPLDAVPLLASGVLDQRLFDVSLLADLRLDDASSPTLPLLVQYNGAARTARSALTAGTTVRRELPIVDALAITQQRVSATLLWNSWTDNQQSKRRTALAGDVRKVWLDGGVKPLLDRSTQQIGAPEAWKAGATGKGVKVAVLDSGIDETHPDLKGRISAAKGFTGDGEDAVDQAGHGTHVASTVAGSGAASDGKYRGVAPDAKLMVGKVCGMYDCEFSAIIAGMEWAATSGARVINLSLGGSPTDGIDPLEQAVNDLTASTGALFVISAGNFGADFSVGSPGEADAALTVASVTKSDGLSAFSSRGPRAYDFGLKPDIAAPGSHIVAARAAGARLEPLAVNDSYADMSGTSMAAPHVTGAAAILAQLHPDWKAEELRSALTGSSLGLPGIGVLGQGAGRVDLTRALKQAVTTSPSKVDLGPVEAPHHDNKPVTKALTYRNDGDKPVTLTLKLSAKGPKGRTAPAGMFKLSRSVVRIPAHGTVTLDVTADTSRPGPDGAYAGWIVATGNGQVVRTAVGVGKALPTYEQKLTILGTDGKPVVVSDELSAGLFVLNVDTLLGYFASSGDTLTLPKGRYLVDGGIAVYTRGQAIYLGEPDVVIDKPGTLVLDARRAKPIKLKAPVAGAVAATGGVGFARPLRDFTFTTGLAIANSFRPDYAPSLSVAPNLTGSAKTFTGFAHLAWAGMPDGQDPDRDFYLDSPYLYHDAISWPARFPDDPSLVTAPKDYARIDGTYLGAKGNRMNNFGYPVLPANDAAGRPVPGFVFTPTVEMTVPFQREEYYSVIGGIRWAFEADTIRILPDGEIRYITLTAMPTRSYPRGKTTRLTWNHAVVGPNFPSSQAGNPGREDEPWVWRDGDILTVAAPMFADAGAGRFGVSEVEKETTSLYRNGSLLRTSESPLLQTFALPAGAGTYRLTKHVQRSEEFFRWSTDITSSWTFRSARAPDGEDTRLPLMSVRFAPKLNERNQALAGRFDIPVRVEHQHGSTKSPVVRLAVEASYDGKTWSSVPVRKTRTGWTATLNQPSAGFVSLRAKARDLNGNTVDQTILRAYELTAD